MEILYHHRTRGKGVEAVHILGIVDGLRRRGHDVSVVGPPGAEVGGRSPGETNRGMAELWKWVSRHLPEVLFELLEIFYNVYAYFRIGRILSRGDVDAVYERYALFQFGGVMAARRHGCPIFLEVNDAASLERVRSLRLKRLACRIERFVFRRAEAVVTISEPFRTYIRRLGVSGRNVGVVPNAIDPRLFDPSGLSSGIRKAFGLEGRFVVGFVGLFVPWHGIPMLFSAFERLARRHDRIHLLLVGDGPDRPLIESWIRRSGLLDRVSITGYQPHERIPDFVRAFDAAVMADSNTYGSPMKIFEYMAMAKAVVAPGYPPIGEVLSDNEDALLFRPKDEKGLTRALDRLIGDPGLRKRLERAARRKVLRDHTWDRNAERVEAMIEAAWSAKHEPASLKRIPC